MANQEHRSVIDRYQYGRDGYAGASQHIDRTCSGAIDALTPGEYVADVEGNNETTSIAYQHGEIERDSDLKEIEVDQQKEENL